MTYVAVMRFADLKDAGRIYEAGENYPRPGLDVAPERIAELAGSDNRMGYPLIKRTETPVEPENSEPKETPTEPPKSAMRGRRSRKKE